MAAVTRETEQFLQRVEAERDWWQRRYTPGQEVPFSGIYRCEVCGKEITSNAEDPFPPQNHHQHENRRAISWQLIIRTDTNGNGFGAR